MEKFIFNTFRYESYSFLWKLVEFRGRSIAMFSFFLLFITNIHLFWKVFCDHSDKVKRTLKFYLHTRWSLIKYGRRKIKEVKLKFSPLYILKCLGKYHAYIRKLELKIHNLFKIHILIQNSWKKNISLHSNIS